VPAEHVTGAAYPEEEKSAKRRINPTAEERSDPPLCVYRREEIQIDQESEREGILGETQYRQKTHYAFEGIR
jgi:hypothetical protein